jgi:uncharacterized repeat protein (TIGR01451 family)
MSNSTPKSFRRYLHRSMLAAILCSPLFSMSIAQAAPLPKDWCGRLWGVKFLVDTSGNVILSTNNQIVWDDPVNLGSTNTLPPTNIATIPALPTSTKSGYASLGIHVRSGTLYTLERNSVSSTSYTLYRYSMSSPTAAWVPTTVTLTAGLNYNKMTVNGDVLTILSSDSLNARIYALDTNTGAIGTASSATYSFITNQTPLPNGTNGTPPGTTGIGSGDIAQDEYGDIYNIIYDSSGTTQYAYFYKLVGTQWSYRARIQKNISTDQYTGLAFYNQSLYAKGSSGQLFKVSLTRAAGATEYGWPALGSAFGAPIATGIGTGDLASCGVPSVSVTKNQQIVTDLAGTAALDQTKVITGQYIKYTIVATNTGDAWARGTFINDTLPAGVTYVPNTATVNGTNISAATYPFINDYVATSPSSAAGEIRLPFSPNTNAATFTFLVQVSGTTSTVQNQATVGYLKPFASDTPNCTSGLNCGVSPPATLAPSIFGNVWNDTNGSAAGTFTNIKDNGEVGTNTGTLNALYAILLNSSGKEIASSPIAANGSYQFLGLNPNQSGLNVQLSTTAGTVNVTTPVAPPLPSIPTGWKNTSPKITSSTAPVTAFTLSSVDVLDRDFGITQPAGVILVKRITAINGITTNDGKNLTLVVDPTTTTTTNDDATKKWPAGYLKGAVNAGRIKPEDTIEYTIYYLNDGVADAKALKICDPIRGRQTYVPGSMKLIPGDTTTPIALTDSVTDTTVDRAYAYGKAALPAVVTAPTDCNTDSIDASLALPAVRDNGGVAIQIIGTSTNPQLTLPALNGATGFGAPSTSYGSFKFTTKVDK